MSGDAVEELVKAAANGDVVKGRRCQQDFLAVDFLWHNLIGTMLALN